MNELTGMYYSPWTERARWALDRQRVPYRYREYTTMIGEPLLRLRLRKPFGKVSVPLLVTPQGPVNDSFLIARFADAQPTAGAPLVPATEADDIRVWVADAELALCSARIRATRRIGKRLDALRERLPAYTPDFLRTPLAPAAWVATEYILAKYDLDANDDAQTFRNMDAFFGKAAAALEGRALVGAAFSFADILIATAVQAITPVDDKFIFLGPASRACMCEPELARKYPGLVAWRDGIYAQYR